VGQVVFRVTSPLWLDERAVELCSDEASLMLPKEASRFLVVALVKMQLEIELGVRI
jgi:hypothetical protein